MLSALHDLPGRLRRITSGRTFLPEIDGLRFFAIGLVVAGHVMDRIIRAQDAVDPVAPQAKEILSFLHSGTGVSLFFAISGFILASQFLSGPQRSPLSSTYLKRYLTRRVTRIEPPYLILLVCTYAILQLNVIPLGDVRHFESEPKSLTTSLFASIFYLHNVLFEAFPRLFPPGWTLELEVQFYLLAPVLFFLYFKIREPAWRVACGLLVAILASLVAFTIASAWPGVHRVNFTLLPEFYLFWIGIVLADLRTCWECRCPPVAGWLGIILLVIAGHFDDDARVGVLALGPLANVIAIILIFGGVFGGGSFRAFCSARWIALIGGACYSVYLTHLQVTELATRLLYKLPTSHLMPLEATLKYGTEVIVVCVVGLVFYAYIERPFMRPGWAMVALHIFER